MRIILSPAKKMNVDTDKLEHEGLPVFLEQTEKILDWLKNKSNESINECLFVEPATDEDNVANEQ